MNSSLVLPLLAALAMVAYSVWAARRRLQLSPEDSARAASVTFGFDDDERVQKWWLGVMYVGDLRPDVDYTSSAVTEARGLSGVQCGVGLSDRGRVSIVPMAALGALVQGRSSEPAMPLFLFSASPRVVLGIDAVSSHERLVRELKRGPRLRSSDGGMADYELIHIEAPELPAGATLWLDPAGARTLLATTGGGV
jgi:hypothetical protein